VVVDTLERPERCRDLPGLDARLTPETEKLPIDAVVIGSSIRLDCSVVVRSFPAVSCLERAGVRVTPYRTGVPHNALHECLTWK